MTTAFVCDLCNLHVYNIAELKREAKRPHSSPTPKDEFVPGFIDELMARSSLKIVRWDCGAYDAGWREGRAAVFTAL